jgi:KaiC/GvpD/RAD55 family RecA-like ATPase
MPYTLPTSWTSQASNFIDQAVNGKANIVVEAVAGAGKTTVLMAVIKGCVENGESVIYIVFNKTNATNMSKWTTGRSLKLLINFIQIILMPALLLIWFLLPSNLALVFLV